MDCIYGGDSVLDLKNLVSMNHANFLSLRNEFFIDSFQILFQLLFCEELSELSESLFMSIAGLFHSTVL